MLKGASVNGSLIGKVYDNLIRKLVPAQILVFSCCGMFYYCGKRDHPTHNIKSETAYPTSIIQDMFTLKL